MIVKGLFNTKEVDADSYGSCMLLYYDHSRKRCYYEWMYAWTLRELRRKGRIGVYRHRHKGSTKIVKLKDVLILDANYSVLSYAQAIIDMCGALQIPPKEAFKYFDLRLKP
jgi:hypothetical protein